MVQCLRICFVLEVKIVLQYINIFNTLYFAHLVGRHIDAELFERFCEWKAIDICVICDWEQLNHCYCSDNIKGRFGIFL